MKGDEPLAPWALDLLRLVLRPDFDRWRRREENLIRGRLFLGDPDLPLNAARRETAAVRYGIEWPRRLAPRDDGPGWFENVVRAAEEDR